MILSQKQSKIVAASDRKNSASSALGIIPHDLCQDERSACRYPFPVHGHRRRMNMPLKSCMVIPTSFQRRRDHANKT